MINLDFNIKESNDPRFLVIQDVSEWDMISEKPAIFEITPPSFIKFSTHYVVKNEDNIFDSEKLKLNYYKSECEVIKTDLPDGVYKIIMKGSPETFNVCKYHLRTNLIDLQLDKMYMEMDLECNDLSCVDYEPFLKIEYLLKSARACVKLGQEEKAKELYMLAKKLTDKKEQCST